MGSLGGSRRKEAGLRWPDIALSDQTGSPLAVRVRIVGLTSDQQQSRHFAQRNRRHLWEDSGMLKICKNYVKPMQKIYSLCRVYIFQIYAQYELWSLARDSGAGPSPAGHWAAGCCRVTESVLLPTRSPSTGLCRCHRARRHSD